jgi:hypothetical protein
MRSTRRVRPLTTIAWRMGHIAVGVFGMRTAAHFDGPVMDDGTVDWPTTADGGLALLDAQHAAWTSHVRASMTTGCGSRAGPPRGRKPSGRSPHWCCT